MGVCVFVCVCGVCVCVCVPDTGNFKAAKMILHSLLRTGGVGGGKAGYIFNSVHSGLK